jgi:ubiquitin-like-conjugating enzyme ATG10
MHKPNSRSTIEYEHFASNITRISQVSKDIGDNWHFREFIQEQGDKICYLEKIEQKFNSNEIHTIQYEIFYSESYSVPVLYLNAYKSNGKLLRTNEMALIFHLNVQCILDMLTQIEHPYFHRPYYYIHPCKTGDWMFETKLNLTNQIELNYTLKWMSFVFSQLNIAFDINYAKFIENK